MNGGQPRWLLGLLVVSMFLNLVVLGWVTWIVVSPRYWFPAAYAAEGPPGDQGPTGPTGAEGPPGPSGDTAEEAVSTLEGEVNTLNTRVEEVDARVDDACQQIYEMVEASPGC